jgi:hypothetical protein
MMVSSMEAIQRVAAPAL